MNIRFLKLFIPVLLVLLFALPVSAVMEINEENESYLFGRDLHTQDAPVPYRLTRMYTYKDFGASQLENIEDMAVSSDGSIFISEKDSKAVYKLPADGSSPLIFTSFSDGKQEVSFESPSGLYIDTQHNLYVADRISGVVYIFDENFTYKNQLNPPAEEETFSSQIYEPLKVCADPGGRIYVVAAKQTQGILQFSREGKFMGFLGSARVQPSWSDLFYRTFGTKEQKASLLRLISTEYNNITSNEDGFIYGTISALTEDSLISSILNNDDTATVVRLLNPKGQDALLRKGSNPPAGDLNFLPAYQVGKGYTRGIAGGSSVMVDVSCRDSGVYSLLDSSRKRVFTYSKSGELLFMFGLGDNADYDISSPSALSYAKNDEIYVADKGTKTVKVFAPTEYAKKIYSVLALHEAGNFDREAEVWNEIHREYMGSELAYLGMGKAQMSKGQYKNAMESFRLGSDKQYYSKAFKEYRKKIGYDYISYIVGGFLLAAISVFVIRRIAKNKLAYEGIPRTLAQRIRYSGHVATHPFKGFWELKADKAGTVGSASVILGLVVLLSFIKTLTTPYLLSADEESNILLQSFSGIFILLLLFVVSSWCFTSLMDGKGTFKDIYIYTCYALFPMLVSLPIQIAISPILSLDEQVLQSFIGSAAVVIVIFLIFVGTLIVHEYSAGKAVVMLLLTVVGMMIIVFIVLLCITLVQQILIYGHNIYSEIQLR